MEIMAAVVGAGRQGLCAAVDLARLPGVRRVRLVDRDAARLEAAERRWRALDVKGVLEPRAASTEGEGGIADAIEGAAAVVSAVPFAFGEAVCEAAVEVGAHVVDLGGNLRASQRILALGERAARRDGCVAPDCGLMPGLGNTLAGAAIDRLERQGDTPPSVTIRCGGLPRVPRNALGYELVFSFDGLVNEYDGASVVLRDGEIREEPTLEDMEPWSHPRLGPLECATTSGGTSTAPQTFARRVRTYEYKTVRFPGHFAFFRTLKRLGAFAPERRDALRTLLEPALVCGAPDDLVLLRVDAAGPKGTRVSWEILEAKDPLTGFTAMERMTALPAVAVLELALEGKLRPGAVRVESDLPYADYFERLTRRGIAGVA